MRIADRFALAVQNVQDVFAARIVLGSSPRLESSL